MVKVFIVLLGQGVISVQLSLIFQTKINNNSTKEQQAPLTFLIVFVKQEKQIQLVCIKIDPVRLAKLLLILLITLNLN